MFEPNTSMIIRVHKVRYAWPQLDIEDPWVLCGHFLYVVSNNGGIQKLSGTYHIQMTDFCAYLCVGTKMLNA